MAGVAGELIWRLDPKLIYSYSLLKYWSGLNESFNSISKAKRNTAQCVKLLFYYGCVLNLLLFDIGFSLLSQNSRQMNYVEMVRTMSHP